jgi:hypothetical protein
MRAVVCLFVCAVVCVVVCLFVCLVACLCVRAVVCAVVYAVVCLFVCLFVCLCARLFARACVRSSVRARVRHLPHLVRAAYLQPRRQGAAAVGVRQGVPYVRLKGGHYIDSLKWRLKVDHNIFVVGPSTLASTKRSVKHLTFPASLPTSPPPAEVNTLTLTQAAGTFTCSEPTDSLTIYLRVQKKVI